tara:strand:- start:404 stop:931 length:528 start_codon:yes stop_codon:yes gene_type:complete
MVLISSLILTLIKFGIIDIESSPDESKSLLNTEFLPYRGGSLTINDFQFCDSVNDNYQCLYSSNSFFQGDAVHFRFSVETSSYQGKIMLVENYQIRNPDGKMIFTVDLANNFHFDLLSENEQEIINFKDFFNVGDDIPLGTYSLDLIMENPLLNKKVTLTKEFEIIGMEFSWLDE